MCTVWSLEKLMGILETVEIVSATIQFFNKGHKNVPQCSALSEKNDVCMYKKNWHV